jgi:hypothetical protein
MEAYIRDRHFTFHSKRLLEELRVFIWQHGKAQAQNGYNDDLVMAAGIGLFIRDTGIKFNQQGIDMTRRAIDGISNTTQAYIPTLPSGQPNPYQIDTPYGPEDISWIL